MYTRGFQYVKNAKIIAEEKLTVIYMCVFVAEILLRKKIRDKKQKDHDITTQQILVPKLRHQYLSIQEQVVFGA